VITGYIAAIAGLEAMVIFGPMMLGLAGYALLIILLLNHYILAGQAPYRRLLPALALIPLLRIFSLATPLRDFPEIYWYILIGAPLLLAALLTSRLLGLSINRLGLGMRSWPVQTVIALSGLPLSLAAFLLVRPLPLVREYNLTTILVGAVILTIFDGFLEEFIFRGLLQGQASELFGMGGLLLGNALFTLMYLGNLSWSYLLLISLVGFYFGWNVRRTGSIWGTAAAHSILKIGLLLAWPLVWG